MLTCLIFLETLDPIILRKKIIANPCVSKLAPLEAGTNQKHCKQETKQTVKNKELWERLDDLNQRKNINWSWVKAHNIDKFNNQVDDLARKAADTLTESSFN